MLAAPVTKDLYYINHFILIFSGLLSLWVFLRAKKTERAPFLYFFLGITFFPIFTLYYVYHFNNIGFVSAYKLNVFLQIFFLVANGCLSNGYYRMIQVGGGFKTQTKSSYWVLIPLVVFCLVLMASFAYIFPWQMKTPLLNFITICGDFSQIVLVTVVLLGIATMRLKSLSLLMLSAVLAMEIQLVSLPGRWYSQMPNTLNTYGAIGL